jgi:hypothetical protein
MFLVRGDEGQGPRAVVVLIERETTLTVIGPRDGRGRVSGETIMLDIVQGMGEVRLRGGGAGGAQSALRGNNEVHGMRGDQVRR